MTVVVFLFLSPSIALAYLLGSACSAIAGFFGMAAALKANVRTAQAAKEGLERAFPIAFYGGAVMGLSIVGLALIGITGLYYVFGDLSVILGFSFGASTLALFAKAGGGIYTKTADIGADLVGKVELGIPEDDARNPAVIADNVGDNVGDVAGMGSDIIDSYIASIVAAMILGAVALGITGTIFPLLLGGLGLIASIIGVLFVRIHGNNPGSALNRGTFATCAIFALFAFLLVNYIGIGINIFYATLVGVIAGIIIGITTDFFTSIDRAPVRNTAEASKTGAAITILSGFSYGIISAVPTILGICVATLVAFYFAGMFGVAIAAVGMLAIVGMTISADAYGPIVDNARGIAEQAKLSRKVMEVTDKLDAAGNTAKAVTKGFAIAAAALTVLALFAAYAEIVHITTLDLMSPYVIVGGFVGAMMPPLLAALLIFAVKKNAFRMVEEVRRQFREIKGLMSGKAKPDYAKCVDIATKGALKELMLPCLLSILVTIAVGLVLGMNALGGYLAGSIFTGLIFALFMANAGGTWDNAKKYIEEGNFGGKHSAAHKAAVIGDTVGDPFKDTAGPSINTLITVMSLTASMFAPMIIAIRLVLFGG
jgi:K(+)-stimulated pyrophosphate-energized sodium pump